MSKYQKSRCWSARCQERSRSGIAPASRVEVRQRRRHFWKNGLLSSIDFTRSLVILMLALVFTLVAGTSVGAVSPQPPSRSPEVQKSRSLSVFESPRSPQGMRDGLMAQAPTPPETPAPSPSAVPAEGKSERIPQVGKGSSNFLRQWLLRSDLLKAPVILDGRLLFEVSQLPELTAAMRAEGIQTALEQVIDSSGKIQLKVEESKTGQIILVNDQYLLTVTAQDTSVGETRATLAQTWATEIETALNKARRERTMNFIAETAIHGLVVLVLAVVTNWGLTRTWQRHKPKLERLVARLPQPDGVDLNYIQNGFLNLLQRLGQLAFWLGVSAYIANLFPLSRQLAYPIAQLLFRIPKIIVAIFTSTIFTLGQDPYSLSDLLILSGLLFALVNAAGRGSQLLRDRILQMTGINRGAREALATIANYSAIGLGTIVILQIWGVDLSSLTIIASALSVGIAFGFQDIAKNFASGLVLLFERPILVGDFVEVGEYTGTVERIGSRSTTIRTLDRISIILPNSRFLEQEVINWSHQDPISRIHIAVGVAYGSDIKAVETALLDTAKEHPHVLKVPPPRVMFKGFGDSSLDFELLVWSNTPEEQYWTKSDLYFRIEQLFRERQIEIPFPQQDLHLRSGTVPLELSPELQQAILLLLQSLNNRYRK